MEKEYLCLSCGNIFTEEGVENPICLECGSDIIDVQEINQN